MTSLCHVYKFYIDLTIKLSPHTLAYINVIIKS